MADPNSVQDYLESAKEWLDSAIKVKDTTPTPAAFNALHSIELAAKACLIAKTGEVYTTHQIGGAFAKHFKEKLNKDLLRELNRKLMRYDGIRYPNAEPTTKTEAEEIIEFAKKVVHRIAPALIEEIQAER